MRKPLNTIDRCFREAQRLVIARAKADREISRAYSIFAKLRPIFAPWMSDDQLVLVALAIWQARRQTIKECQLCQNARAQ